MSEPVREGLVATLILVRRLAIAGLGASVLLRQYAIERVVGTVSRWLGGVR